jgi:hypothetical protein
MANPTGKGGFKPGESGNPGGRPTVAKEIQELARSYTTEALEALVAIMRNARAPAQARVAASNSILDRGYGRPPQSVDLYHKSQDISELMEEINGRTRGIPSGNRSVQ